MVTEDDIRQKLLDKVATLLDAEWGPTWAPAGEIGQLVEAYSTLVDLTVLDDELFELELDDELEDGSN